MDFNMHPEYKYHSHPLPSYANHLWGINRLAELFVILDGTLYPLRSVNILSVAEAARASVDLRFQHYSRLDSRKWFSISLH